MRKLCRVSIRPAAKFWSCAASGAINHMRAPRQAWHWIRGRSRYCIGMAMWVAHNLCRSNRSTDTGKSIAPLGLHHRQPSIPFLRTRPLHVYSDLPRVARCPGASVTLCLQLEEDELHVKHTILPSVIPGSSSRGCIIMPVFVTDPIGGRSARQGVFLDNGCHALTAPPSRGTSTVFHIIPYIYTRLIVSHNI